MLGFDFKKTAPIKLEAEKQAAEKKLAAQREKFGVSTGATIYTPICYECKHKHKNLTCKAYPKGIPIGILTGELNHKKPVEGDGGIQFEAKAKE